MNSTTRVQLDKFVRHTICRLSGRPALEEDPLPRVPGYAPVREIGRGGFGTVFLVISMDGTEHALKMYLADDGQPSGEDVTTKLTQDRFTHDNVVEVVDAGQADARRRFVVMKYCRGGSLADRLGEGFAERSAVEMLEQLARGVAAIHAHGIIHRDLTPNNILFDADKKTPKITDFGLSQWNVPHLPTSPSRVAFTPQYVAPERFQGIAEDERSDVYSLGAIGYAMLTGSPPVGQVGRASPAHAAPTAVSVRELRPDVTRGLAAIIHRCLAPNRDHRFPTAAALAEELRRHLRGAWVLWTRLALARRHLMAHLRRRGPIYVLFFVALGSWELAQRDRRAEAEEAARREKSLRAAAEEQRTQAEASAQLAISLQAEMEQSRAAAEASARALVGVAGFSRFQLALPGGARLVDQARDQLATLASAAERDPRRAAEAAELYRQCGKITFNLGDLRRAATDYDSALRLAEQAVHTNDIPENQLLLAKVLREWGVTRAAQRKLPVPVPEAQRAWARAAQLLDPLLAAGPDYRFTRALLHLVEGNTATTVAEKRTHYASAEQFLNDLLRASPKSPEYRFALAEILNNRGRLAADNPAEREKDCQRAVDIRRALVTEQPGNPDQKAYLAASLNHLGNAFQVQGPTRAAEARTAYEESLKMYQSLVEAFPGVASNREELKQVEYNLARLQKQAEQP